MTYFAFSALLNCLTGILLGILIFLKDRKKENRLFSYWAFSISFWSFGYYMWQISTDAPAALFWCKFLMMGATLIPVAYLHFILVLLKIGGWHRLVLKFAYISAIFFLSISYTTDWLVKSVEKKLFFEFWPTPGILYPEFLAFSFFGLLIYSWILMYLKLRKAPEGHAKTQLQYLLFGTVPMYIGGGTNFPLWYNIPLVPWGNIFVSLLMVFTAIALIRQRFFDIKTIIAEILVSTMGFVLMIVPFLMPDAGSKALMVGVFLFYCIIGYMLIKSTMKEVKAKETFEQRVKERTKELEIAFEELKTSKEELEKFYKLTIGRELRMAELKEQIKGLEQKEIKN